MSKNPLLFTKKEYSEAHVGSLCLEVFAMSDFKNILAYAGVDKGGISRLELAADLAVEFGAHLTGIHIIPQAVYTPYYAIEFPTEVYDRLQSHEQEITDDLRDTFHSIVAKKNINNYHWRQFGSTVGDCSHVLVRHCHYQDIVIVPQRPHEKEYDNAITPEACITGSGIPTLVTPEATSFSCEHSHILLAWNSSMQSTRAMQAALPLLKRAKKVHVLMIDLKDNYPQHDPIKHSESMTLYFQNHNIDVIVHAYENTDNLNIKDVIFNFINDHQVNLLVMGGYSHLRLTEALFGGVSYEILKNSSIPVLITH